MQKICMQNLNFFNFYANLSSRPLQIPPLLFSIFFCFDNKLNVCMKSMKIKLIGQMAHGSRHPGA